MARLPHNLNITIPGVSGSKLHRALRSRVACSSGSACSRGEPSHVLMALGHSRQEAEPPYDSAWGVAPQIATSIRPFRRLTTSFTNCVINREINSARRYFPAKPFNKHLVMSDITENSRLHVLQAIEEGWNAFAKAPWTFLLFQALVAVIALPFAALAGLSGARLAAVEGIPEIHPAGAAFLLVVGLVGYVIVVLWGVVGIVRGAWSSLEGQKPSFSTFVRWDGEQLATLYSWN